MTVPNTHSYLSLPPGRLGFPLLGETIAFLRDPDFAQKRHQKHGAVFKTHLFGKPTVFMRGTDANRFILTHENEYFVVSWPPSTKALLGSLSLALQLGHTHQSRRKLLAQAFMPRALSGYLDTMEQITATYLQRWEQQGILVWYPELRNYTLDIACKLFVGMDSGSQTSLGQWFETWCQGLFSLPIPLPWTRFGKAKRCRHQMQRELDQVIQSRQHQADPGQDALGLLIQAEDEEGQRLSREELNDQVLLLLFAGHETLTSAIASFCLLTAQYPDVLDRLRAEQATFDPTEPLTLEILKQMTYLEQVLKESLRLIPPVGGGFRTAIASCTYQGYTIPKGWGVLYQIGPTHLDESLYVNATQFDPERFSPEQLSSRGSDQQRFGYVPFGGGIRECLGKEFARLEMKLFATRLLRGYSWELLPNQDLTLVTIPTPHPRDGLQVKFQRRSD